MEKIQRQTRQGQNQHGYKSLKEHCNNHCNDLEQSCAKISGEIKSLKEQNSLSCHHVINRKSTSWSNSFHVQGACELRREQKGRKGGRGIMDLRTTKEGSKTQNQTYHVRQFPSSKSPLPTREKRMPPGGTPSSQLLAPSPSSSI